MNMERAESDIYVKNLGKLVANLQSLEFVLRAFLINREIASGSTFPQSKSLNNMSVGDVVDENAFTNFDTLSKLIDKYNEDTRVKASGLTIEKYLVEIRDAIVHGRVSSDTPLGNSRLLKFDKPKGKKVKVTFSVTMTKEWFSKQIKQVYNAILSVSEANNRLQSGKL